MHFRIGTVEDIPVLHRLIEGVYRDEGGPSRGWTSEADLLGGQRIDHEGLREIIEGADQDMVLVDDEADGLIGCVQLIRKAADRYYFGMFSIDGRAQGRGAGKLLLDHIEAHARDHGGRVMEIQVIKQREELIGWYERRGYVRTGETRPFPMDDPKYGIPKRDDLEFIVMEKPLG